MRYEKPAVRTLGAREILEALGPAAALGSGAPKQDETDGPFGILPKEQ